MDFYRSSNAYAISVRGNFIQNIPYLVLLPDMEIKLSKIFYFQFHLISKLFHFSHFSSSDQSVLQTCTQEKALIPIILNSQKIKQELGDLFGSKSPTMGNFNLSPAFNY